MRLIRRRVARLVVAILGFAAVAPAVAGDAPCPAAALCETPLGSYGLLFPPAHAPGVRVPVVVFFHGWGSAAGNVLADAGIVETVRSRGYALLVPEGLPDPETGARGWSHRGSPHRNRDEVAFLREVVADAAGRAPIDPDRILVSGFSAGGSMVWHLACYDGDRYRAFAPIAGAFWEPLPESCPGGPVDLLHLQGFADEVVPIEGRRIGDRWQQGDLYASLALLRRKNGLRSAPDRIIFEGRYRCRMWTGNAEGRLGLCLHDGGHILPDDWLERAIDWFEALPQG